ncbi:MAG: SH3 domain-containing protein [Aggregatilineales bacterium]
MRLLLIGTFIMIFVGIGLAIQPTQAQNEEVCPAFVEQAIIEVGDLCENLGRNVACYGHNDVESTLYQGVSVSRFDAPADRIELTSLNTIRTAPLNESLGRWGIALLSAQANLPGTVPGQNVVMMLVGDASLENQITPDQHISTGSLVTVEVELPTNLRDQPSITGNIVGSVEAGTRLSADMISEDQTWIRIPQPAGDVVWISRDLVSENSGLNQLPHPSPTQISPMQSFYFNAGIGQSTCAEASGTLFIQGPNNIRVDLQVNGVDISIGSTIALSFVSPTQMQVATLSGTGYVVGTTVPAGHAVTIDLDSNHIGIPESVSVVQRMDDATIARYGLSEAIPENLLHYQIQLQPITELVSNDVPDGNVSTINGVVTSTINTVPSVVNTTVGTVNNVTGGMVQTGVNVGNSGIGVDVGVNVGGIGADVGLDVGGDEGLNLNLNLDLDGDGDGLNLNLNLFGR